MERQATIKALPAFTAMVLSLFLASQVTPASAYSRWCGKYYQVGSPTTPPPPSSKFAFPQQSLLSPLDFRCETASSIYIQGDVHDPPQIIFDAEVNWETRQLLSSTEGDLSVSIMVDGRIIADHLSVELGASGVSIPIDINLLTPKTTTYEMTCIATLHGQTFTHTTELIYAPPRSHGSIVKVDRKTGALMVRKGQGLWERIFPFGWYDSIDVNERPGTLPPTAQTGRDPVRSNIERLQLASRAGFNIIHPVPPSTTYLSDDDDPAPFLSYLDQAESLGLWVMFDTRHAFTDTQLVAQQVEQFRDHPAILTWYIADEPDGPEGDIHAALRAKAAVRSVDLYHPVSLVLNCDDYYWKEFVAATDLLLVDPYPIALNGGWSKRYNTPVDENFGCSGCDGCKGSLYDTINRLENWSRRRQALGRSRTLPFWIVPQAFNDHGEEFWWREPLGVEVAAQIVIAFNHGVMGHCAWIASSASPDNFNNASMIARHLFEQSSFIIDNAPRRRQVSTSHPHDGQNGIDLAAWSQTRDGVRTTLILAACFNYLGANDRIEFEAVGVAGRIQKVLFGDVRSVDDKIVFSMGGPSVAGVLLQSRSPEEEVIAQTALPGAGLNIMTHTSGQLGP